MEGIVLTKESNEKDIKAYFNAVLKLTQSKNEFPVNLDEVWPLVYPRKDHAVRDLKESFIKGIDYQVFPKNGENPQGGRPTEEYYLTVPCMEFFIARKVRPVFEIYRQVFHATANYIAASVTVPKLSEKLQAATWAAKFLNLNENSRLLLAKQILDPLGLPTPDYTPSRGILKSATELLKERGLKTTAKDFNLCALAEGYLCEQTRKSSNGGAKAFKSITEKGKPYGENQVSPHNPKETQPLWYADKFDGLLYALGITGKDEREARP